MNQSVETLNNTFSIMHQLAGSEKGLTIGEIERTLNWMSRAQVIKVLDNLSAVGFTYHEVVAHGRTGKKIYRMTESCAIHCAAIARGYTEKN